MPTAIGGNVRYPNLQSIADLFRFKINDTFSNSTGSGTGSGGGAGLIMPNSNPDLVTLLDSAIQETYSDLRNIGDPELIIDNYIIPALPALTKTDPAVQVSLAYTGFFNGFTWDSTKKLPISLSKVLMLWERQTNTQDNFYPMTQAPFGLPGQLQGQTMKMWEMRQGQIWMPGCLQVTDIRLRGRITYPEYLSPVNLNYSTTYVPILDSRNAMVSKMMVQYAMRFAPENYQMAIAEEARQMAKLQLEVVRQMQAQENQRAEFGAEAVEDFAIAWSWL
jgi:hypothetical protein